MSNKCAHTPQWLCSQTQMLLLGMRATGQSELACLPSMAAGLRSELRCGKTSSSPSLDCGSLHSSIHSCGITQMQGCTCSRTRPQLKDHSSSLHSSTLHCNRLHSPSLWPGMHCQPHSMLRQASPLGGLILLLQPVLLQSLLQAAAQTLLLPMQTLSPATLLL